jgi:hypothetical protein
MPCRVAVKQPRAVLLGGCSRGSLRPASANALPAPSTIDKSTGSEWRSTSALPLIRLVASSLCVCRQQNCHMPCHVAVKQPSAVLLGGCSRGSLRPASANALPTPSTIDKSTGNEWRNTSALPLIGWSHLPCVCAANRTVTCCVMMQSSSHGLCCWVGAAGVACGRPQRMHCRCHPPSTSQQTTSGTVYLRPGLLSSNQSWVHDDVALCETWSTMTSSCMQQPAAATAASNRCDNVL